MPIISPEFKFSSKTAENFVFCSKRNICWNSGYGAGKTYAAMQKLILLMTKFPGYRAAIGRQNYTELTRTTMQTFFKACPPEFYSPENGGANVQSRPAYVRFYNGSMIYWMHFDQYDESALRSLEINMAIIDQAEEVSENVYLTLDSRVGRWDKVEIPQDLLDLNPNWPKNPFTGNPMAPSYMMILCNPPDEGEFSYIWQRYHPDSPEYKAKYHLTHQYFESASGENKALPPEVLATMMSRDPEWVQRYVFGKFSRGEGAIHEISPLSLLETDPNYESELFVTPEWIERHVIKKGNLSRSFDHGASAPASCTWWASLPKGIYICYREYYQPNRIISHHRQAVTELSGDEYYSFSVADPQIFKRQNEKNGGFWSVADEYADSTLGGTPIYWQPADNNEFATRNRINELLAIDPELEHPVTGKKGSPRIFFIKKSKVYPHGVYHAIRETVSQKKALIGTVNGKNIYGDDRDESIDDHAYDTVRYQCATHLAAKKTQIMKPRPNSFIAMRNRIKSLKSSGYFDRYGMPTLQ